MSAKLSSGFDLIIFPLNRKSKKIDSSHFVRKMSNNTQASVPWRRASRRISMDDPRQANYWDTFEIAKFNVNNYYAYYRRGLARAIGDPWRFENAARKPSRQLYRHHLQARRIRGLWENIYRESLPERDGGRLRFRPVTPGHPRDGRAHDQARMLQQTIDANAFPFRVLKTLGAGGNGVAVLCDTDDVAQGGGARKRFVVKMILDGAAPMDVEKRHMLVCSVLPACPIWKLNRINLQHCSIC